MTYPAIEVSEQDGLPVRLYEFRRGQIVHRYTSADRDIAWNSQTWASVPGGFLDGGVRASGSTEQDELSVTCAWDNDVVAMFRGTPPSDQVSLTVRRVHLTDNDLEAAVAWVGLITAMRQPAPGKAEFFCQSIMSTFQQEGLRLAYSRSCPHFLYDENCRVAKASFLTAVSVDSVSGQTVTATGLNAKPDGYFDGGFIEWDLDMLGTKERRPIESHLGNVLTLLTLTDGLAVSTAISVYPGCSRDTATCSAKFNNLVNYGGFPHMPGTNPFEIGVLNGADTGDNTLTEGDGWDREDWGQGDGSGGPQDGGGVTQTPTDDSSYMESGGEGGM